MPPNLTVVASCRQARPAAQRLLPARAALRADVRVVAEIEPAGWHAEALLRHAARREVHAHGTLVALHDPAVFPYSEHFRAVIPLSGSAVPRHDAVGDQRQGLALT